MKSLDVNQINSSVKEFVSVIKCDGCKRVLSVSFGYTENGMPKSGALLKKCSYVSRKGHFCSKCI